MKKVSLTLSLILIGVFMVLNAVGTRLSPAIGVVYSGQILLLLALSVFLLFYVGKNHLGNAVGLTKVDSRDAKTSLYYIPLVVMILANGAFFFDKTLPFLNILMVIAFMACIAFCEEVLFRGLLFKGIEARSNTKRAMLISGITFGLGHIINLLNGYTGIQQVIQVVLAILIGLLLSVLFVRTKTIVPGIVFHFLYNLASALSREVEPLQNYMMVGVIIVVAGGYLAYLLRKGSLMGR
jgi:membrane protease YdiL (CAAX protease family)